VFADGHELSNARRRRCRDDDTRMMWRKKQAEQVRGATGVGSIFFGWPRSKVLSLTGPGGLLK
jgi:hypothetical protein